MTQHDFQPDDGARMDESQSIDEQPKHHTPQGFSDHFALGFTKILRFFADTFFAKRYGHRAIV